jgi:hypothetical protein
MMYLFRAGVRAALKRENSHPDAERIYAEWEETLVKALKAGDRQAEDFCLYPTSSIMGGTQQPFGWSGIGAANPYGPALLFPGYGGN